MQSVWAVIMAGGRGERFWPWSRCERPKQFLTLQGNRTLLQHTYERLKKLVPVERLLVVTGRRYADLTRRQLPDLPPDNLLLEPVGRDTAPCIGLAALWVSARDPDAVMVVVPSDHFVSPEEEFLGCLKACTRVARMEDDPVVVIGVPPSRPETAYGYIKTGEQIEVLDGYPVYRVERFTEKPDRQTAERFLARGNYFWNSGMFIWSVSGVWYEIGRHLPDLERGLRSLRPHIGRPTFEEELARVFPQLPKISIDYGVMEKADNVLMLPARFAWDDLGSWSALPRIHDTDEAGNVVVGEHVGVDTEDCVLVSQGRLLATVGVRDLIVVETEDAVLVCRRDCDQRLKELLEELRARGKEALL